MSTAEMFCDIDDELRSAGEVLFDASEQPVATLKVKIARLSDLDIQRMTSFQLVDVIKASGMFALREWFPKLQFMEQDELKRLAYLARRSFRREINTAYKHRNWQVPFLSEL